MFNQDTEELTYWYFRFNYLFLITRFVIHSSNRDEVDLLVFKPKNSIEIVKGKNQARTLEVDANLLNILDLNTQEYKTSRIRLIIEVSVG